MSNKFKKILSILSMSTFIFSSSSFISAFTMVEKTGTKWSVKEWRDTDSCPTGLYNHGPFFAGAQTLLIFNYPIGRTYQTSYIYTPIKFNNSQDPQLDSIVKFIATAILKIPANFSIDYRSGSARIPLTGNTYDIYTCTFRKGFSRPSQSKYAIQKIKL